jgi:hypothetical protein
MIAEPAHRQRLGRQMVRKDSMVMQSILPIERYVTTVVKARIHNKKVFFMKCFQPHITLQKLFKMPIKDAHWKLN